MGNRVVIEEKKTVDEFDTVTGVAVSDLDTASNEFQTCR